MVSNQKLNYEALKRSIAQRELSITNLELLKLQFKEEIRSNRRFACIKSLTDLLDCLERRGCLSEYDISALQYIAQCLDDHEIQIVLQRYIPPPLSDRPKNIYAMRRFLERNGNQAKNNQSIVYEYTDEKREAIKRHITREIGKSWRFFGLALDLRAGDLDAIEQKYPTDLHGKVYEVFRVFEADTQLGPSDHCDKILRALENCKRKDIIRDVRRIMLS